MSVAPETMHVVQQIPPLSPSVPLGRNAGFLGMSWSVCEARVIAQCQHQVALAMRVHAWLIPQCTQAQNTLGTVPAF